MKICLMKSWISWMRLMQQGGQRGARLLKGFLSNGTRLFESRIRRPKESSSFLNANFPGAQALSKRAAT